MLEKKLMRGAGVLGLAALGGCHGGITLHTIVLLISLGIFVSTILLDRS
ncbi:MAG: hypothetical protein OEM15_00415 [Myxococcales bacterium]|nr:hypothetical protein [Myxococcales bacterium]